MKGVDVVDGVEEGRKSGCRRPETDPFRVPHSWFTVLPDPQGPEVCSRRAESRCVRPHVIERVGVIPRTFNLTRPSDLGFSVVTSLAKRVH